MSKEKTLIKITLLTVMISICAVFFIKREQINDAHAENSVFVSGLIEKVSGVDSIVIEQHDKKIEFFLENDFWQLTNKYPANKNLINNLLLDVCNLKLLDKKTSKEDQLEKLDLTNDKGLRLILRSKVDGDILDLMIGSSYDVAIGEESRAKMFVRYTDNNQTYLVLGSQKLAHLNTNLASWIEQPLERLESIKNVRKLTLIDENNNETIFLRWSPEGNFGLINKESNFDLAKLNHFISDLIALECQNVNVKPKLLPSASSVLGLGMQNNYNAEGDGSSSSADEMQVVIETFDDLQYAFKISAMDNQIVAQIDTKFVKQFPSEYPMVYKPMQKILASLSAKQDYVFTLDKNVYNNLKIAQGVILNE